MKLRCRMSDLDKATTQNPQNEVKTSSESPTPVKSLNKKLLFNHINTDLKSALDTWEVLTEQVTTKVSREEEQLHEVKKLLQDLKKKLSEFSE